MDWQERISHCVVNTLFCSLFPKDYLKCFNVDMQKRQVDLLFCPNFEEYTTSLMSADLLLIPTTQRGQPHHCVYFSVWAFTHMRVGTV